MVQEQVIWQHGVSLNYLMMYLHVLLERRSMTETYPKMDLMNVNDYLLSFNININITKLLQRHIYVVDINLLEVSNCVSRTLVPLLRRAGSLTAVNRGGLWCA